MQTFNNVQMNGRSCSPKHGPKHFTVLKNLFVWIVWSFSKTFELMAGLCSPKHGPVLFTVWMEFIFMVILQPCLRLGRAPQHPLSRPSSFRGVEESFHSDVMQTFNNVQTNGWSCSPKHGPAHFTVLKILVIWMVWNFSKTFEHMAGLCSSKHGPVVFTLLKNLFVLMFCSHAKPFKFMAGPRSPTSSVTAQLISRRWRIVSFWCCAHFHYCSNERMVVLPQTRSRAFHGVDDYFYRVGMKLFKKIRTYGLVVLPQTRPSSFHRVEKPFRLNIKRSSLWLGRAPQHPCHGPAYFAALKNRFVLMLCRHSTTFKRKAF